MDITYLGTNSIQDILKERKEMALNILREKDYLYSICYAVINSYVSGIGEDKMTLEECMVEFRSQEEQSDSEELHNAWTSWLNDPAYYVVKRDDL